MKIMLLDKRHKASDRFLCYVVPPYSPPAGSYAEVFLMWREWCWETFGPGTERDLAHLKPDTTWGWNIDNDSGQYRLYFKTMNELNWFKLRWA